MSQMQKEAVHLYRGVTNDMKLHLFRIYVNYSSLSNNRNKYKQLHKDKQKSFC